MNNDIVVSLSNALRDYFHNELSKPVELPEEETEEERRKRLVSTEGATAEFPPVVTLSIAEQVAALAAAMGYALVDCAEHVFPQNWSKSSFTDMQHGNGGSYIGTAYVNDDTGREFMVEKDGAQYWL